MWVKWPDILKLPLPPRKSRYQEYTSNAFQLVNSLLLASKEQFLLVAGSNTNKIDFYQADTILFRGTWQRSVTFTKNRALQVEKKQLLLGEEDTVHFTKEYRPADLLFPLFSSFFCPFVMCCFGSMRYKIELSTQMVFFLTSINNWRCFCRMVIYDVLSTFAATSKYPATLFTCVCVLFF